MIIIISVDLLYTFIYKNQFTYTNKVVPIYNYVYMYTIILRIIILVLFYMHFVV